MGNGLGSEPPHINLPESMDHQSYQRVNIIICNWSLLLNLEVWSVIGIMVFRIMKSHSGDHAPVICTKNRVLTILVIIRYTIDFWRRVFLYFERRGKKKEHGKISLIHPISLH